MLLYRHRQAWHFVSVLLVLWALSGFFTMLAAAASPASAKSHDSGAISGAPGDLGGAAEQGADSLSRSEYLDVGSVDEEPLGQPSLSPLEISLNLIKLAVVTGMVLLLFWLSARGLKSYMSALSSGRFGGRIEVIESSRLFTDKALFIVRVDGRELLIGCSKDTISLLLELGSSKAQALETGSGLETTRQRGLQASADSPQALSERLAALGASVSNALSRFVARIRSMVAARQAGTIADVVGRGAEAGGRGAKAADRRGKAAGFGVRAAGRDGEAVGFGAQLDRARSEFGRLLDEEIAAATSGRESTPSPSMPAGAWQSEQEAVQIEGQDAPTASRGAISSSLKSGSGVASDDPLKSREFELERLRRLVEKSQRRGL